MASKNEHLKKKLSDKEIEMVETMSGYGMTIAQIAVMLKMSEVTFSRMVKKDDTLRDRLEQGRVKASTMLRQGAYQQAKAGNTQMTIFLLKTREGFRETDRLEITGKDGGPLIMGRELRKQRLARLKKFMDDTDDEDEENGSD